VDESALRYFAAQGDTRRVEAETARLRALYPNWTPPTDLTGPVQTTDEQLDRMWQLYAEGRLGEARAAIAARQAAEPEWQIPQDLQTALDESEARRRIVNASEAGQWRTVIAVATETPTLLTCANVDTMWRVGEAFVRTEQPDRGRDAYEYVVRNCTNTGERLATLQKALELLPEDRILDLLKLERAGEFAPIRDELARRRVARASADPKLIASAEDLTVVGRLATASTAPDNALQLAWYYYSHADSAKALPWFQMALTKNGGPKAAEGQVLSLHALKRFLEAEAFGYEWRERTPDNMRAYLEAVAALFSMDPPLRVDPAVVARTIPAILKEQSTAAAQGIGWYARNTCQDRASEEWFTTALSWTPDDEPSAYGLAVARQRLRDLPGVRQVMHAWRTRSERIANVLNYREPTRNRCDEDRSVRRRSDTFGAAAPAGDPQTTGSIAATVEMLDAVRVDFAALRVTGVEGSVAIEDSRPEDGRRPARTERPAAIRVADGRCTTSRSVAALPAASALTLAWCLMEADRPLQAAPAFERVLEVGDAGQRQEAAYGKTLAYLRKGLTADAAVAATDAPQSRQRNAEVGAVILEQRALAAFRDERYVETILALEERTRLAPEQNDLLLLRGYSHLRLGQYDDAERVFRAVQRAGLVAEGGAGLTAVLQATGVIRTE
jgi:tetratricopeptide (TPR) repeat protein